MVDVTFLDQVIQKGTTTIDKTDFTLQNDLVLKNHFHEVIHKRPNRIKYSIRRKHF